MHSAMAVLEMCLFFFSFFFFNSRMLDNRKDIQEFKSYGNPESPEELKSISLNVNDKVDL